jgi:hypothetical protein
MQYFRDVEWESTFHEEQHHSDDGNTYTTAYYVISDWKIPFTFADWLKNIGFGTTTGPEKIYEHCSNRLTQPFCKKFVLDAATKLEADPGFVHAFEKMASFYILRLLAGIPRKEAWKTWQKIPKTDALLKDEVFCLCVVALHPVLYGKLHPIARNNRRVCLEAIALWDLPKYSLLQFCHPHTMLSFGGKKIHQNTIGLEIQAHKPVEQHYWVFDDYYIITRIIGKPGKRRWFELQFAGPTAIQMLVKERQQHNSSIESLKPFLEKNKYINI